MCAMLTMLGDSAIPEKTQTGGVEDILFSTPPRIFRLVTLPSEIPVKTSFNVLHNCVPPAPLERSKTKIHGNYAWFFLEQPWKFHLLLINWPITTCLRSYYRFTLSTDIDIPILKYLATYTDLNGIFEWITQPNTVQLLGHSRKNPNNKVDWGHGIASGIKCRKSTWKLQGLSKKQVEFPEVIKKFIRDFHGSWFLNGIGISNECSKILWNFQGWSFVFFRISKGKVTNLKSLRIFFKKVCHLFGFFLE